MSNELKIVDDLGRCADNKVDIVMQVITAVYPNKYKNVKTQELLAETNGINMLTKGIDKVVLIEMCKRALNTYCVSNGNESNNKKVFFDINYIMRFYRDTFNDINCNFVKFDWHNAKKISQTEERLENRCLLVKQCWIDNGAEYNIQYLTEPDYNYNYTPVDFKNMINTLDNVDI